MWHSAVGIFLGQGKYAVEILKRFSMMDCMTTPMASNLKLLSDASSETIDATMYRQMIGSLMYLRLDTCLAVNTLKHVHLTVAKGTIDYGLKYDTNQNISMEGYVDSY